MGVVSVESKYAVNTISLDSGLYSTVANVKLILFELLAEPYFENVSGGFVIV